MKTAYLTVDDVPSRNFLPKMNYLALHTIPALFFCIGKNMKDHENEICSAIKKGFVIGNHSFSHPHFSDLSIEECQQEIFETDRLIDLFYKKAGTARPGNFFRFPYFDVGGDESGFAYEQKAKGPKEERLNYSQDEKRKQIQKFLVQLGYTQPNFQGIALNFSQNPRLLQDVDVKCTFDQAEYFLGKADAPRELASEDGILARIDKDLPYEGLSPNCEDTTDIILIHDHENTSELFYRIIDRYLEKKITFKLAGTQHGTMNRLATER